MPKSRKKAQVGNFWLIVGAVVVLAVVLTLVKRQFKVLAQATGNPPYTFTVAGDYDGTTQTDLVLAGIGTSGAAFNLGVGDLRYGSKTDENGWCSYVKSVVGDTFPFELVAGNHENPGEEGTFTGNDIATFASCLPDRMSSVGTYGREYYFDTNNNTRVIMVSPNIKLYAADGVTVLDQYAYAAPGGVPDVHYQWLSDRIDEAKTAGKWVIVGMHKVCITAGVKGCEIGEDVMKLLINKHVDLVFHGHDHTYQRTHALSNAAEKSFSSSYIADDGTDNMYVKGAGTVFVVVGTGGRSNPALYSINSADSEAGYFVTTMGGNTTNPPGPTFGYIKVNVTDEALAVNFVPAAMGTFSDSFTIGTPPTPTIGDSPTPTPQPVTVTFNPTADVRVQEDFPTSTYGGSSYIRVNNGTGNKARTFMKFNLLGQGGVVASAKLRLWINSNSGSGTNDTHLIKALADTTSWVETTLDWDPQPVIGSQVGILPVPVGGGSAPAGTMIEATIDPAYVQSKLGGDLGLVLDYCVVGSAGCATVDSANYDSKEGVNKPVLVINYAVPNTPTSTLAVDSPTPTLILSPTDSPTPGPTNTPTNTPTTTPVPTSTPVPTPTSTQTVLVLTAAADAAINSTNPTTNYGNTTSMSADKSPILDFVVKYNVVGTAGKSIVNAKLRLYVVNPSNGSGGSYYKTSDTSWSETGVTWNTAPAKSGSVLATVGPVSNHTYVDVNVTGSVLGDGVVGYRVSSTSTDGADYATRNVSNSGQRPQLILTLQ